MKFFSNNFTQVSEEFNNNSRLLKRQLRHFVISGLLIIIIAWLRSYKEDTLGLRTPHSFLPDGVNLVPEGMQDPIDLSSKFLPRARSSTSLGRGGASFIKTFFLILIMYSVIKEMRKIFYTANKRIFLLENLDELQEREAFFKDLESAYNALPTAEKERLQRLGLTEAEEVDEPRLKYICPLSKRLIRSLYIVEVKDEQDRIWRRAYDEEYIIDWLKYNDLCPLTRRQVQNAREPNQQETADYETYIKRLASQVLQQEDHIPSEQVRSFAL